MSKYTQIIALKKYPEYKALEGIINEYKRYLTEQLVGENNDVIRGKIQGANEIMNILNKADIYEKSMAEENSQSSESSDNEG